MGFRHLLSRVINLDVKTKTLYFGLSTSWVDHILLTNAKRSGHKFQKT